MAEFPTVKLADCVDLLAGFAFKSQHFTDKPGDIALVKGENVSQGCILWDISKRWPATDWATLEKYQLRSGDVVVAMDRPWVPAGLKWGFIRNDDPKALLVQRCSRLRSKTPKLDQDFLRFVIGGPSFESYVLPITTGVNVPHISGKQILDYEFRLPPFPIQRRIASILSAYDELIENSRRRIKILESMARAIYREWFVTAPMVQDWPRKALGDFITLKRGFDLPDRLRRPGLVPVVSSSGVTGSHDESKIVGPGLVTGRYGTLGEIHLVWENFWPLNTSLYVADFKNTPLLYAYWLLQDVLKNQTGSAAAVPGLNRNHLHQLPCWAPPQELMQRFQTVVAPMAEQSRRLERQVQNLRRARDLLLPRLLSGQIEVEAA